MPAWRRRGLDVSVALKWLSTLFGDPIFLTMPHVLRYFVTLFILVFTATSLDAQNLFTTFGGIPTPHIAVTTDDRGIVLRARQQGIVPRPVVRSKTYVDATAGYGYGYAFEAPHFTFVLDTALNLALDKRRAERALRFFDDEGELIFRLNNVDTETISQHYVPRRGGTTCVFEIDLHAVPTILLDDIAQVDITVRS